MKIITLNIVGNVPSMSEAMRLVGQAGDAALIERGHPRILLLGCPCGCGERFPINLDPRAGPAWRIYGGGRTSLYPSVWRDSGCKSHYIIWNGRIYLLTDADSDFLPDDVPTSFIDAIVDQLSDTTFRSYIEIADTIGAVPWEVLVACRKLSSSGRATEGRGGHAGFFKRLNIGYPHQDARRIDKKV